MTPYAALYERLSREEDNDGESASIAHQKEVLENYAVNHGYPHFRHFTDDGYTGTNFQRPGFQEMLREVEQGHVSAVIVREYGFFLGFGMLLDFLFHLACPGRRPALPALGFCGLLLRLLVCHAFGSRREGNSRFRSKDGFIRHTAL